MLEAEVDRRGDQVFLLLDNFEFEIVVRSTPEHTVDMLQRLLATPRPVLRLLAEAQVLVDGWRGLLTAGAKTKPRMTTERPLPPQDDFADRVSKEISDVLAQAQSPTSGSTSGSTSA